METNDHLKGISHKRPDLYSISDFITRTTASNITKEGLADIIADLIKQNKMIKKKSINGRDLFRRNTIDAFSTTDETSGTQQQSEKDHNDNNKSIAHSSSQHYHLIKATLIPCAFPNS